MQARTYDEVMAQLLEILAERQQLFAIKAPLEAFEKLFSRDSQGNEEIRIRIITSLDGKKFNSLLHLAAEFNRADIIEHYGAYFSHAHTNATIEQTNLDDDTALHISIRHNKSHIAKKLLLLSVKRIITTKNITRGPLWNFCQDLGDSPRTLLGVLAKNGDIFKELIDASSLPISLVAELRKLYYLEPLEKIAEHFENYHAFAMTFPETTGIFAEREFLQRKSTGGQSLAFLMEWASSSSNLLKLIQVYIYHNSHTWMFDRQAEKNLIQKLQEKLEYQLHQREPRVYIGNVEELKKLQDSIALLRGILELLGIQVGTLFFKEQNTPQETAEWRAKIEKEYASIIDRQLARDKKSHQQRAKFYMQYGIKELAYKHYYQAYKIAMQKPMDTDFLKTLFGDDKEMIPGDVMIAFYNYYKEVNIDRAQEFLKESAHYETTGDDHVLEEARQRHVFRAHEIKILNYIQAGNADQIIELVTGEILSTEKFSSAEKSSRAVTAHNKSIEKMLPQYYEDILCMIFMQINFPEKKLSSIFNYDFLVKLTHLRDAAKVCGYAEETKNAIAYFLVKVCKESDARKHMALIFHYGLNMGRQFIEKMLDKEKSLLSRLSSFLPPISAQFYELLRKHDFADPKKLPDTLSESAYQEFCHLQKKNESEYAALCGDFGSDPRSLYVASQGNTQNERLSLQLTPFHTL